MFHHTEAFGDAVAAELLEDDGSVARRTYREYAEMTYRAAGSLQAVLSVSESEIVPLVYETCMDWPVLFWAVLMSGATPLLVNPQADDAVIGGLIRDAGARAYIAAEPLVGSDAKWVDAASLLSGTKPGREVWGKYIGLCTSGTTGDSRIFLYDFDTVFCQLKGLQETIDGDYRQFSTEVGNPVAKILAFLPFHHVFGLLSTFFFRVIFGHVIVFLKNKSYDEIFRSCRTLGVNYVYAVPMLFNGFAAIAEKQFLKGAPLTEENCRLIREKTFGTEICAMISGGGHIPKETLALINEIGYPIGNGFGMTEVGIIANASYRPKEVRVSGSVGSLLAFLDGKIEPEGADEGELFVRGGTVYTASVADGKVTPRDPDAWFDTGDVVRMKDGDLWIVGRNKDVIIGSSGENVYPDEIEDRFEAIKTRTKFCVFGLAKGTDEEVAAVFEGEENRDAVLSAVLEGNRSLDPDHRIRRLFLSEKPLPLAGSMKVKRQLVKKEIGEGTWPVCEIALDDAGKEARSAVLPASVDKEAFDAILQKVKAIASESMDVDPEDVDEMADLYTGLGVDSLKMVSLLGETEEAFGVMIVDRDKKYYHNLYELALIVYGKLHNTAAMPAGAEPEEKVERITDFTKSPEYIKFAKRIKDTFSEVNPYAVAHDSVIRDTSIIDGKEVINMGSYNYLGMSGHPETVKAAIEAIKKYGTSSSGSRSLAGEKTIYRDMEKTIAKWKHTDDAIVCTGGWATNVAFVSCFMKEGDLILYDERSHSSVIEGARLSHADSKAFAHNDMKELEEILKRIEGKYHKVLLAAEGVYSMDGDMGPVPELIALKKKYKCFLVIDEAHSGGILGEHGGGCDEYYNLAPDDIDIKYGTMSKALGTVGGYVAARQEIIDYLRGSMSGFVFTAGIAPPLAAACQKTVELIMSDNTPVQNLHRNIRYFVRRAKEEGLVKDHCGETPIVPIVVGSDLDAAKLSGELLKRGIFIPPAMYPAVPIGQARLRVSISSTHSIEQLETVIVNIADAMRKGDFRK